MKRKSLLVSLTALIAITVAPSANAASFFGVLAPQAAPVAISLSAATIKINQSATATAAGGSGDGAFSFATATPAKCSINSVGVITPIAAGACSVTATRASSGVFLSRTSNPATVTITALDGTTEEEAPPQTDANGNLISATAKPTFSSDVDVNGTKALVTWKLSTKVNVTVASKKGESRYEGVARTEEGGVLEIPNLEPGYRYTFTVTNDDEKFSQVFQRSVAPAKVTRISGLSASMATNYAFVVKWEPQSYVEYYKIEITGLDDQPLTYYSKSPDFYLFDRTAKSYIFAVSAQGEGGEFSEPVKFRASLTAPVNITAKLPTNPVSNKLTTASSNQLKAIANRLTAQTEVTVTVFYDSKVKGAKKLAQTRVNRAAATLKVAKPSLLVKTQVRKQISTKSLSQISITTKAPARKMTLTNA
ncbi:MAG: hypothetical protein EBX92_05235 [Actinobacteria bacterium]|nr:hypothetical protein [Actinomycetota bacterium]